MSGRGATGNEIRGARLPATGGRHIGTLPVSFRDSAS